MALKWTIQKSMERGKTFHHFSVKINSEEIGTPCHPTWNSNKRPTGGINQRSSIPIVVLHRCKVVMNQNESKANVVVGISNFNNMF